MARFPPFEARMMVRTVKGSERTFDGLEEIRTPNRSADRDRSSGVDRAFHRPLLEKTYLEPDPAFGRLLSRNRIGVDEEEISYDDSDLVEAEQIEHGCLLYGALARRGAATSFLGSPYRSGLF